MLHFRGTNSEFKALILHIGSGNVCIPTLNFPVHSWWLTPFMGCSASTSALLELSLACQGARMTGGEVKACRSVPLEVTETGGEEGQGHFCELTPSCGLWCSSLCLLCLCICLTWTLVFALKCRSSWAPPSLLQYSEHPGKKLIPDRSAHIHPCLCYEL